MATSTAENPIVSTALPMITVGVPAALSAFAVRLHAVAAAATITQPINAVVRRQRRDLVQE
jgi:hypothetical protein